MNDDLNIGDKEIITRLESKYDINNPEDVKKLYSLLASGSIKFHGDLGKNFDDKIYDLYLNYKNQGVYDVNKKNKLTSEKNINDKKLKKCNKNQLNETESSLPMDDSMKKLVEKEIIKQNRIRKIIIFILSILAIACISYFCLFYYYADKSERDLKNLTKLIDSDSLVKNKKKSKKTPLITDDLNQNNREILSKYESLYISNNKLIGWLKIADTNIDYPVMQCDDNEFYLTHNFNSDDDKAGSLFLDCNNNINSDDDNYIIYGHHLTSGKMFSSLGNYEKKDFYEKHKFITFDTIYEEHTYEVMFVFRSKVFKEDEVVFKYYQFINANSEEEFNSYIGEMKNLAFYDTGLSAEYGDTFLTLSTCDYHEENGRFVVVAKRIK